MPQDAGPAGERWRQLRSVFEAALDQPSESRDAALSAACGADRGLHREVAALLASTGHAEQYFRDLAERAGIGGGGPPVPADAPAPAPAGSRIGGYEVLRPLGRGGMAAVYLVHDPKHDRVVALKVLDQDVGETVGPERFLREIRVAAHLQHPHILPVFDSGATDGRLWFTMPYVTGGTLRDRLRREGELPITAAVRLVRELALALDEAHRQGVVHRDVKPENILLTADGEPLLADFGIARPAGGVGHTLTGAGALVGTPAYMSPEQADGSTAIDGRSDLYALGCVLFELLAGEPPFTGPTPRSIMAKRLAAPAPDVSVVRDRVPAGVREALAKVMSRSPADRYSSGAAFAKVLDQALAEPTTGPQRPVWRSRARGVAAVGVMLGTVLALAWVLQRAGASGDSVVPDAAEAPPRLAVLPFRNLGAPQDVWFAAGVTDEITSHLAVRPELRVISRTSADRYAADRRSLREIGRELGVTYVLEGTVKWEQADSGGSGSVQVTPQLIRVNDDSHLWTGHYRAETVVGLLQVQTIIARHVAEALGVAIDADRLGARGAGGQGDRTADAQAYTLYLRGRHFWSQRTGESLRLAVRHFEQAIARDTGFAAARAGLAGASVVLPLFTGEEPLEAWRAGRRAAEGALARDSSIGEAHAALAFGLMAYEWDWTAAEASFRRALAFNPNDANARHWFSALLGITGREDEALAEQQRAADLDPLSSVIGTDFGWTLYAAGRVEDAVRQLQEVIQLDSLFAPAHSTLASVYLKLGDLDRAVAAAERAAMLSGRDAERLGVLSYVLAMSGRRLEAGHVLQELERGADSAFVPPTAVATAYLGLGDRRRALEWLARAVAERDALFVLNHQDPLYDPIRTDPGFTNLLRRIGLAR